MPSFFGLPHQAPHERVLIAADAASGLRTLIAVHSTARGPAFAVPLVTKRATLRVSPVAPIK